MCWSHQYVLIPVACIVLYKMKNLLHVKISLSLFQYVPLKAWLYRDGFARFSGIRFSLSSIDDKCIPFSTIVVGFFCIKLNADTFTNIHLALGYQHNKFRLCLMNCHVKINFK